jgi:hypothetical protein
MQKAIDQVSGHAIMPLLTDLGYITHEDGDHNITFIRFKNKRDITERHELCLAFSRSEITFYADRIYLEMNNNREIRDFYFSESDLDFIFQYICRHLNKFKVFKSL